MRLGGWNSFVGHVVPCQTETMVVRFGRVEVDLDRIEIRIDGAVQPVQPQVFDVIRYLYERRDRMVTKEELLDNVWGDRFVSESTLTSRIKSARRVLGDNGRDQAVIRTVHGRGYRFVAEPAIDSDPATAEGARVSKVPPPPVARDGSLDDERDRWPLVGRYEVLDRIVDALAEPGVGGVVLIGPAGIGKTRLAIESLRRRADDGGATYRITASTAAAAIPLAALAPLVGIGVADVGGLAPDIARTALFHRAVNDVTQRAEESGRLLVMIDDVDRLDELSAAVLGAAMDAGAVSIVGTRRTGTGRDPLEELVRAGRLRELEVAPLDDTDVDVALYRVLAGPIDLASLERLSALSRGWPGLLRDLVESSQASGSLVREDGVWRLVGPVTSTASENWPPDGLDAEAVTAAELLSLVSDLHFDDAEALLGDASLDALDAAGLLTLERDDDDTIVRLTDPLLAETVSAAIGPVRVRRHKATLMEALTHGRKRPRDLAAIVRWSDELERPLDPVDALAAAQLALRQGSDAAADVLVGHLDGEAAGPYPLVIKAELAYRRAQYRRSEELFQQVDLAEVDPSTAAFVLRRTATMMYQVHADYRGSADWLAAREAEVSPRVAASLRAHRVSLLILLGCADEALATAAPLLADVRGARAIEVHLASARARVLRGELDVALDMVAEQEAALAGVRLSGPDARLPAEGALSIRLTAMLLRGDVLVAERLLRDNLVLGGRTSRSWSPLSAAEIALEVGRVRAAIELIRPTLEMYRAQGMENGRIACAALHARALAELGRREAAEAALDELWTDVTRVVGANRWYVADAMARVARGLGRGPECVGLLVEQAEAAESWGARTSAANLLALAAVVGPEGTAAEVTDRVTDLAATIDGRLWPIRSRHVRTLAEGGPLGPVEAAYVELGYRGFAAMAADTGRAVAGPA